MRYWWVNQNQTYAQERAGNYLWSPKRKANAQRNPFYEFMREVAPGDIIFSFRDTYVPAVGIAQSVCFEAPKPTEFGQAGQNWSDVGWMIRVQYHDMQTPVRPSRHMDLLAPLLPSKYSPLRPNGHGSQSIYLTAVPPAMATALIGLLGHEARSLVDGVADRGDLDDLVLASSPQQLTDWEDHISEAIQRTPSITETERKALIMARRGQGQFKLNVSRYERRCRITHVERIEHLIASHTKPWRDCETNEERLDGANGFLLTPTIDHLFDRGFISFENNGKLLISPVAHPESMRRMGVPVDDVRNVGDFTSEQKRYLEFRRDRVFLAAQINTD
jgi:putative restriction endonuclease